MWSLYLLPGRLITHLFFLFPGSNRGSITATRRRDESGCAQFLFATLFWVPVGLIGGLFAIAYFVGPPPNGRGAGAPVRSPSAAFHVATGQAMDMIGVGQGSDEPSAEPSADQAASSASPVSATNEAAEQIAIDPQASAKIERAMRKAAQTGKAVHWKDRRLRGYAVPSVDAVGGCHMVQVSIDHRDDLTIQPVQICDVTNSIAPQ